MSDVLLSVCCEYVCSAGHTSLFLRTDGVGISSLPGYVSFHHRFDYSNRTKQEAGVSEFTFQELFKRFQVNAIVG